LQEVFSTEPGKTGEYSNGSDAKDVFVIRVKESLATVMKNIHF
jgi:hypothetical protein